MPKAEISWKRLNEDGVRLQVYAHHVGRDWIFYNRERRFDQWRRIEEPPLDDWLKLLDALRRSINRRRFRPEEETHVVKLIKDRYPEWSE